MNTRSQSTLSQIQKYIQKSLWVKVLLIYLVWHILVSGIGLYAAHEFGSGSVVPASVRSQIPKLLKSTVQFDSYHYLLIVDNGYGLEKNASAVFFPLFPSAVRALTVLNIPAVWAGFLINTVAGYFACLFLVLLAQQFFKKRSELALNTLMIFLVFPTAYFMTAFYTEALFCALGFGAFYFARQRKWALACIMLAGITATRLPGLVFVFAVFIEYLASKQFSYKRLDRNILWFLLAPLGIITYMIFLSIRFNDPLFFMHAYSLSNWTYQKFNPNIFATVFGQISWLFGRVVLHQNVQNVGNSGVLHTAMFLASWLVLVGATIWAYIKKYPVSYIVLIATSAVLFAINSNFISVNRYILPMFPIYLLLADYFANKKSSFTVYIAGSAMIMTLLLVLFSVGHWTG